MDRCDGNIVLSNCYKNKLELGCTYNKSIEEKISKILGDIEEYPWWVDLLDWLNRSQLPRQSAIVTNLPHATELYMNIYVVTLLHLLYGLYTPNLTSDAIVSVWKLTSIE